MTKWYDSHAASHCHWGGVYLKVVRIYITHPLGRESVFRLGFEPRTRQLKGHPLYLLSYRNNCLIETVCYRRDSNPRKFISNEILLFFPISSMLRIVIDQTANINNKKPISSHIIISTYRIWPRSLCPLGHYSLAASVGLEPHIFSGWKATAH